MTLATSIERVAGMPSWAVDLGLYNPAAISSQWVKQIRSSLGLSQENMALILGMGPRTIPYWEQGETVPRFEWALLLQQVELRKIGSGHFPFSESLLYRHLQVMTKEERRAVAAALINELLPLLEADGAKEHDAIGVGAAG